MQMPPIHQADGTRTKTGHAALWVGSGIAAAVLAHWLFGEVKAGVHDAVLGLAFFGGLGVAFPKQVSAYAKGLSGVLTAWRKK